MHQCVGNLYLCKSTSIMTCQYFFFHEKKFRGGVPYKLLLLWVQKLFKMIDEKKFAGKWPLMKQCKNDFRYVFFKVTFYFCAKLLWHFNYGTWNCTNWFFCIWLSKVGNEQFTYFGLLVTYLLKCFNFWQKPVTEIICNLIKKSNKYQLFVRTFSSFFHKESLHIVKQKLQ